MRMQRSRVYKRPGGLLLYDLVQGFHQHRCCDRLAHQALKNSKIRKKIVAKAADILLQTEVKVDECGFIRLLLHYMIAKEIYSGAFVAYPGSSVKSGDSCVLRLP